MTPNSGVAIPRPPLPPPQALYSPQGEPARWAFVPAPPAPRGGRGEDPSGLAAAKEFLARLLAAHFLAGKLPALTLTADPMGRPHLRLDGAPGPEVSFSRAAGRLYAAMAAPGARLGVDAAAPGEFAGDYPRARVFHEAEWQAAASLTHGDREEAAALLWSVKEAVVKARGCGFRFFGPRWVRVDFAGLGERGPLWSARLDGPSPEPLPAASLRLDRVWLTVAWIK